MSDVARVALGLFAVMATPGALTAFTSLAALPPSVRLRSAGVAALLAFAGLGFVAAINQPLLDWLAVSAESFQLAAGIVMLPLAFRLLWTGETPSPRSSSSPWRAWALLCGPVPAVLMLSYSARFGFGDALGGAAVALAASAGVLLTGGWLASRLGPGRGVLGRFNGALIVILAVELMLDGIQSV